MAGIERKRLLKMNRALYEFIINGIDTNIEFQSRILNNPDYLAGQFDTSFLEDNLCSSSVMHGGAG